MDGMPAHSVLQLYPGEGLYPYRKSQLRVLDRLAMEKLPPGHCLRYRSVVAKSNCHIGLAIGIAAG